jgi:hypothetical protein
MIVFPAATILQAPFYYQADEAVNYGGIGCYRSRNLILMTQVLVTMQMEI